MIAAVCLSKALTIFQQPIAKTNPPKLVVPPLVVTLTIPLAPLPTTAAIVLSLTTVKEDAAVPPKVTAVAPVKPVPLMVSVMPAVAVVGVKEVIVGTTENSS